MSGKPRISVLLPLQDQRETGLDCARAWAGQTADADSFEVIALAPGEDAGLERSVRPLLREQDRWIVERGADEYELFNLGAREGRGEFVFVTEAHCVPEPDCLEAMLSELELTGAPGIRGMSVPEAQGALGELERSAFEEALAVEEEPDHWRKVLIHSLAIRRDLYLEAGGLPPEFGDFAPWVLAIALRERGHRLRFSPRPRVRHVYDGDLAHLGAHVRSFGLGEMRYRCGCPAELAHRYLETEQEWEERLEHTRAGARQGLRAGVALRHPGAAGTALRHAAVAVLGPRASIGAARVRAGWAARRARRATDPEARARHFLDFWRLRSRLGRLEGLAATKQAPPDVRAAAELDLTEPLAGRAIGLHPPEPADSGQAFRWTAPLAMLRVLVPGSSRARASLGLLPFDRPEGARSANPRIAVDNRVVPIEVADEEISFELDPGDRWISLACNPLRPRRYGAEDPRVLGLPIRSLSFEGARVGGGPLAFRAMATGTPDPGFWSGKRVAVTGGAGFLGKPTTASLRELGAEVSVIRSADYDLRERDAARRALEGSQVVLHLAANVGGIGFNRRNPAPLAYDNLVMSLSVFEAVRELGIEKLIAAGSVCAYPKFTPVPFSEDDIWNGYPEESNAPYGLAKKMNFVLSDAYRRQYGVNSCVPVMANLYGPGDNFDLEDSHVIAAMVHKYVVAVERGEPEVVLWGTGEPSREFLYVDDAARALLLCAEKLDVSDPVNIGTGTETRIRGLAEMISELSGFEGKTIWDASRPDGQPKRYLDVTRARELIGFEADVSLRDGLERTIESFRADHSVAGSPA